MLKHASQTPLAGERLAQAFAHLPEGVFTNLFLDHATTAALIAERAFDFVNFTGCVSWRPGDRARRRRHLHRRSGSSSAARTPATSGPTPTSTRPSTR